MLPSFLLVSLLLRPLESKPLLLQSPLFLHLLSAVLTPAPSLAASQSWRRLRLGLRRARVPFRGSGPPAASPPHPGANVKIRYRAPQPKSYGGHRSPQLLFLPPPRVSTSLSSSSLPPSCLPPFAFLPSSLPVSSVLLPHPSFVPPSALAPSSLPSPPQPCSLFHAHAPSLPSPPVLPPPFIPPPLSPFLPPLSENRGIFRRFQESPKTLDEFLGEKNKPTNASRCLRQPSHVPPPCLLGQPFSAQRPPSTQCATSPTPCNCPSCCSHPDAAIPHIFTPCPCTQLPFMLLCSCLPQRILPALLLNSPYAALLMPQLPNCCSAHACTELNRLNSFFLPCCSTPLIAPRVPLSTLESPQRPPATTFPVPRAHA